MEAASSHDKSAPSLPKQNIWVEKTVTKTIKELETLQWSMNQSKVLPNTDDCVYLNLCKDGKTYCVELSTPGYRIVSEKLDSIDSDQNGRKHFEDIYKLLNSVSQGQCTTAFHEILCNKLEKLAEKQSKD